MHVLVADSIDVTALDALAQAGHRVTADPGLSAAALPENMESVDALVVRSTKVQADAIQAASSLALIVRAGAGTENVDVQAASDRGVHVCNVPGRNAVAVAELTLGLLLAVDRHIVAGTADLRAGIWNKKRYAEAEGLMGRTLGIIGLGEIGLAVAERAKAFGLTLVGQRKAGRAPDVESRIRGIGIRLVDTLEEVVGAADIISLHVPGGPATKGLLDADLLGRLADRAVVLNTSRGDCIDEAALIEVMDRRGVRAGIDVFCDEPPPGAAEVDSRLARHPNVVGTHHIGASTRQAQRAVAAGVVETIEAFAAGQPTNCINLRPRSNDSYTLTVRHLDRVGVLAAVFGVLRAGGLNVQHMANRVFEGDVAAVASIDVSASVSTDLRDQLQSIPDVLGVSVSKAVS